MHMAHPCRRKVGPYDSRCVCDRNRDLYWERSCGSGSAAAAAALACVIKIACPHPQGTGRPHFHQAAMKDGKLTGITIGGPVRIDASYEFTF